MQNKISPFLALKVTHFRNYLIGAFLSEIGNQMQTVAIAWQVYEMTRNPASLGLIGLAIAGFLIAGVGVAAVYFVNALSFLFFIGAILSLSVSLHHKIEHQGKAIIASLIVYGLATIGFGLSKFFPLSILFLVLVGFGDMTSTIIRNTIRQVITPDHLRGRMASVMRIFFQGGPQLGDMEAGFLAKAVGGPISVVVGGLGVLVVLSLLTFQGKALRDYHGKDLAV